MTREQRVIDIDQPPAVLVTLDEALDQPDGFVIHLVMADGSEHKDLCVYSHDGRFIKAIPIGELTEPLYFDSHDVAQIEIEYG